MLIRMMACLLAACLLAAGSPRSGADGPTSPAATRPAWDDPTLTPEARANRALEAANALDEEAQRSTNLAESRAKWRDAAKLLDDCTAKNPAVDLAPSLRFQAAVYLWASQRAVLDQVDLLAPSSPARVATAQALDDVIDRLKAVPTPPKDPGDPFAQNVRFRLAQALADRARLRPELELARFDTEKEAAALLDRSIDSPRLKVFARLLHAELANRLGQHGPAQIEAEEAEKFDPRPPAAAVAEIKVNALAGRGQFGEAKDLIDRSPISADQKTLWKLRVERARRKITPPPADRAAIEGGMFGLADSFRDARTPEARRGLMELARAIDEPRSDSPPGWWDLLAEGYLLLQEPERAGRLASKGADCAEGMRSDQAAPLWFKAAACWFQAEKYADADAALARLLRLAETPRALRARAGMLRALSQGRALAARQPGATRATYLAALEAQVKDFPDDPTTGEARWLLGKLRAAANRPDDAIALWSAIGRGQPRWLDAQAGAADLAINAVNDLWINRDQATTRPRFEAARAMIRQALGAAAEGDESALLGLKLARLELIPGVGQPAEAMPILDQILRSAASPEQHRLARLGRLVALAELNRFAEAETLARNEAKVDDLPRLLPTIRLLDQAAATTEGDLIRKRTGALIRNLLDRWVEPADRSPDEFRDEVRLRYVRAVIFAGDPAGARRTITRWGGIGGNQMADPGHLRDLGDTYFRLEAYALAIEVERIRATRLVTGSPAWFDARYGLALALFRSDRAKEARKIIDATSILHPDLGGGETRARFERLGQKISAEAD